MPVFHALTMKNSAGGASRRSGPTIVREAPLTDAAAPGAALADVAPRQDALRVPPSSSPTPRPASAPLAPTQGPAAGGPSTDAAAPAAASADEAPSKSALRPAPSSTTRRSTPAAPAPTIVPSRARSVRFAEDETTPPRPARLLSSAERLDLIKERPDLDVRDMPWYLRKLARKSAAKKRTPKMRKVAPPAEAAAGHVEDADATSNPPAPSSKKPSSSCPNSAPSKVTAPSSSMPKGVNAASEPASKPTKALDIDTIKGWTRDRSAIVDVKRPRYDAIAAAAADPLAPRLAPAAAPELAAVVARLHGGDGASARAALPVNRRGAEAAPAPAPARFSARFDDDVEVARGGGEGEGEGASLGAAPFAGCDDDGAAPPPFAPPPDEDDDAFAGLAPPPLVDDDDDEDALLAPPPGAASFDAGGVDDLHAVEPDADEAASGIVPSTDDREWHPNTVKVATLLRDHLADRDALSFGAFTRGADKRSAASAFVELLHLKTWDFVALDQPHAYGDISIAKAACFHDEVPAAA